MTRASLKALLEKIEQAQVCGEGELQHILGPAELKELHEACNYLLER